MYSFLICICILVLGYFIYGRIIDRIFQPDPSRPTPSTSMADGVDYVPLPTWKVFMIQFLNIAGTGPIFGAIMGAKFGPSCYLWIVFGCIFAGAVHDYMTGMLSVRHGGASLPEIIGHYQGPTIKRIVTVLLLLMMMLVGTVFVYSPALILGDIAAVSSNGTTSAMFWVAVVFIYYIVATVLPIDKLIGKIYPLFAFSLLFMAFSLLVCLIVKWPSIPEFWDGLGNKGPEVGIKGQSIFPCLFITVACGAISGFHGTQSPIMARCIKNERHGRAIFFGSMICEGIVALIWAAVSSYFFFDGGMAEVGATSGQAPEVVITVSKSWLGIIGGILAILGVVAAPITSGDTVFRSSRLILSEMLHISQKPVRNRMVIGIPLFLAASLLLWFNMANEDGFNIIWRYFGWANQSIGCFTLWTVAIYLNRNRPKMHFLLAAIPAAFMTSVTITYIFVDKTGFNLPDVITPYLAVLFFVMPLVMFEMFSYNSRHTGRELIQKKQ